MDGDAAAALTVLKEAKTKPIDYDQFSWPDSFFSLLKENIRRFPELFMAAALLIGTLMIIALLLVRSSLTKARQLSALNSSLSEEIQERKTLEDQTIELNETLEKRLDDLAHLNEELAAARDKALEGSRLKSEFVANISHEIRTPLSAVIGMNSLLLNTTKLDSTQTDYAESANHAAQSLLGLINDILDFSKMEAGKLEISNVKFSLKNVLDSVMEMLAVEAKHKEISLKLDLDEKLNKDYMGDPARLRQVLVNLANNAIKFTSKGNVEIAVTPGDTVASERIRFSVKDTGIGISEEAQSKLFRPFVQADGSTTRQFGGTGLGLSISKRLVELMGGTIKLKSQEGIGSTFYFDLPLELVSNSDQSKNEGIHTNVFDPSVLLGPILVAEDSPVIQRMIKQLLEKLGCKVSIVSNGKEAVDAASKNHYCLIFMDWQMPELDGLQATKKIREFEESTGKRTPIIALTANAMQGDKNTCLAAGMDSYLSKPFKIDELQAKILKYGLRK